jgi:uncharacterized membrane protein
LINSHGKSFSFIKKNFIYIKNKIKSKWSTFTKSILFYPIVFSAITFIGFLLTSRIDESFGNEFNVDTPFVSSLIFTGSADSARSVLSAIAGGWTTILGVAFSITLVTLQLSTSRYTSHLVNKFEEDRINKLTLGWFISVVLYSLLVLKSVRTDEGSIEIFIPIVGVNVAISIALIGLFIFALFLSNISSYLKPKILVSKLVSQIIDSIKAEGKRNSDTELLQDIQEELSRERRKKILEIKAKRNGIFRYIDWNTISLGLQETFKDSNKTSISLEFIKSIGEWVETGNTLVTVYEENNNENKEEKIVSSFVDKNSTLSNKIEKEIDNKKHLNYKHKENIINDFRNQILSSIDINKDRDISKDPMLGIELLRNLAIKSAKKNDIDIANSCITGLFRILIFLLKGHDNFGLPFKIKVNTNVNTRNENNADKKEKLKNKNNHVNDVNDNITSLSSPLSSRKNDYTNTIIITIKPKEKRLTSVIFSDLSIISNMSTTAENIPIIKHILAEYISFSKELLENEKNDEFYLITNWYSKTFLHTSFKSLPKEFQHELFINPLQDFRNFLLYNYPHIKKGFDIYMNNIMNT